MKTIYKISMLVACVLLCGRMQSQILNYDFENLNVGDKVAQTIGDPWTTWSNLPGSDEDALISDEHTIGSRSLKIDNGNDVLLKLGDKTTGAYKISFDMYIPEGKEGYFNVLHEFNQTSPNNANRWAFEIFFKSEEHGNYVNPASYYSDGIINPFDVPYDEWFNVKVNIDVAGYYIVVEINNTVICQLAYTACSVAAMDLFTNVSNNEYYIDNIAFDEWDEILVHNIVPKDGDINRYIAVNHVDSISYQIKNEGNSAGSYTSWIDFSVGADTGSEKTIHYDTDPYYNYGNYNNAPYIEIGACFFPNQLISFDCIGTKITQMQYYLPTSYPTAQVGCDGPITFRIYNYQTSDILAEKIVDTYSGGEWLEVVFDDPVPITGYRVLATVGFQQIEQGYPISLDQGPSNIAFGDLIRLNGGDWFSLNYNAQSYGQQDWGNHNIRLVCEGEPVNTSWIRNISQSISGALLPEQSFLINIEFDATNQEEGVYNASLVIATNNDENPVISVPIMLKITQESVDENSDVKYNLYPNPVKDIIHIDGEDLNCAVLYNSNGQIISIVEIIDNALNVNELENGVYYLSIINKNGESAIEKIVIAR